MAIERANASAACEVKPGARRQNGADPRVSVVNGVPPVRDALLVASISAIIVGLQWFCAARSDPFYTAFPPNTDMFTYWSWGHAIAGGDWLSSAFTRNGPFFYGPVYSYFLSLLMVLGGGAHMVHGVQAALGVLTALLVWRSALILFGRRAALASGIMAALCAPLLFYGQQMLMEGLLVAMHAALICCVLEAGRNRSSRRVLMIFVAGLLSGLVTLARSSFLPLLPFVCGVVAWPLLRSHTRGEAIRAAGVFLIGAGCILGACLVRNICVSGQWVLTTANGPMNFYIGNAPDSNGVLDLPRSFQQLVARYGSESAVPWTSELAASLRGRWAVLPGLYLRKLWIFWNSYDAADNVSYYLSKIYQPLVRWSPVNWITLVPLGLAGVWFSRRSWREQTILYAYVLLFPASIALVFVLGRYRLPVLLPLLMWSGVAVVGYWDAACSRRYRSLALQLVWVLPAMWLLWPANSPAVSANGISGRATNLVRLNDYNNQAQGWLDLGKSDLAIIAIERGLEAYPLTPSLVAKASSCYIATGQPQRAVDLLETYIRVKGQAPAAMQKLAEARAAVASNTHRSADLP